MSTPEDKAFEHRFVYKIIVDMYEGDGTYALAWHTYLENNINFPFIARDTKSSSAKELTITGILDEEECTDDMYVYCTVTDNSKTDELPLSLKDLEIISGDDATKQAVNDWIYWCARGNNLSDFDEPYEEDYY